MREELLNLAYSIHHGDQIVSSVAIRHHRDRDTVTDKESVFELVSFELNCGDIACVRKPTN